MKPKVSKRAGAGADSPGQRLQEAGEAFDQLEGVVAGEAVGDDHVAGAEHELVALDERDETRTPLGVELHQLRLGRFGRRGRSIGQPDRKNYTLNHQYF